MNTVELHEAVGTVQSTDTKGIWLVKLIAGDIDGSSGFYPSEVLERDGPRVFPKGTQMYLDHPTDLEDSERPERSVKDLAAVQVEDAYFLAEGFDGPGLYARVQSAPRYRDDFQFWGEHQAAEVSIRATGIREFDESTGRNVVTELLQGHSVDIVTRAGAGGRLIKMTESARQSAGTTTGPNVLQLSESDTGMLRDLVAANKELVERMTKLEEAAKAKAEADKPTGLTPGELYAKLADSGLPAVCAQRLANSYNAEMDLDAAIAEERKLVDEISAAVPGKREDNAEPVTDTEPVAAAVNESARGVGHVQESKRDTMAAISDNLNDIFGVL